MISKYVKADVPESRNIRIVIIKPSKYDDEGYVIRHFRGVLPSNTLACLSSLTQEVAKHKLLGNDVTLQVDLFDDTVQKIPVDRIIKSNRLPKQRTIIVLAGVQSNHSPAPPILRENSELGAFKCLLADSM
jgi:hypothetical protein